MPKISNAEANVYGVGAPDQRLSFRERLMKRFAAHEWVRVINIDNERFTWQYLPSHAEEFEFTPDPMKITRRGEVEAYALDPGESEVIVGENAYLMIEGLYKKLVAKKVIASSPNLEKSQARNFNWTDTTLQEQFIDRIYLGKEKLSFRSPRATSANLAEAVKEIDENKSAAKAKTTATRMRRSAA